jgi:colicin import membrane protein
MAGPAFLVALFALAAAVFFFLSARAARTRLAERDAEESARRAEVEAARKAAADLRTELKERRDEAGQLRTDLERAKKKSFEQLEAVKRGGGAQGLREEVDKLGHRLAEARAEVEHQGEKLRAAEKELEKATEAAARQKLRADAAVAAAAAAPAPVAAAPAPAPGADGAALAEKVRELAAEKERADKAEARLADLRKRVAELERDLKGARGRLETEKRVYIVQRGELELAADRYAELRRRHDALRRDHDELVEAVRQAAREERRLTQKEAARAEVKTPPAPPEGETEGQASDEGAA